MKKITILIFSLFFIGCVTPQTKTPQIDSSIAKIEEKKQREIAAKAWSESVKRLHKIGYPILTHGISLCEERTKASIGSIVWNAHTFSEEWRETVKDVFDIDESLQFFYVIPHSPAHQAGLRDKDVLLSINGWLVPSGKEAEKKFLEYLSNTLKKDNPVSVIVRRGKKDIALEILPKRACDYDLVLNNSDVKNAFADGQRVVIYRGLMDFFKTDEEAALVIAHELAHNSMKHIDSKKKNAAIGGVAGLFLDIAAAYYGVNTQGRFSNTGANIGAISYSVEFEKEADYVGLYFMALAGYEIENVANFWRRMAALNPESIQIKKSHPTTPERFLSIEKAVDEIKNKQKNSLPLIPEYKEK